MGEYILLAIMAFTLSYGIMYIRKRDKIISDLIKRIENIENGRDYDPTGSG